MFYKLDLIYDVLLSEIIKQDGIVRKSNDLIYGLKLHIRSLNTCSFNYIKNDRKRHNRYP